MSFSSSSNSYKEAMLGARSINGGTSGTAGENNDEESSYMAVKGRRTKRQRVQRLGGPPTATTASSTTTTTTTSVGSYANTAEEEEEEEEEEDMANCLILLAQGPKVRSRSTVPKKVGDGRGGGGTNSKVGGRRYVEPASPTDEKVCLYMYECKTCRKRFPSFQALGGHRTSHTKPRPVTGTTGTATTTAGSGLLTTDGKKSTSDEEDFNLQMSIAPSHPKPIVANNNNAIGGGSKPRVHECAICGSQFSSGQALGGHMRRHRPIAAPNTTTKLSSERKKERSLLPLDLNLPAPSDQQDFSISPPSSPATTSATAAVPAAAAAFPFSPGTNPHPVLFSSLVDCHY